MISMLKNRNLRCRQTIRSDEEWADNTAYTSDSWKQEFEDFLYHPHRSLLLEKISSYAPFSSLLEIGCGYGPNLYLVAKNFPNTKLIGIDINSLAVQRGNNFFKEKGFSNVRLSVGKVQKLDRFDEKQFDIIVTDAMLIYIKPDDIMSSIREMLRIGKVLILNEWHCYNIFLAICTDFYYCFKLKYEAIKFSGEKIDILSYLFRPRSVSLGLYTGHWTRDYITLIKQFIPKEKITITKIPKNCWDDRKWLRWGAIIEVDNR